MATTYITDVTQYFDIDYTILSNRIKNISNWNLQDLDSAANNLIHDDDKKAYNNTVRNYGNMDESFVTCTLDNSLPLEKFIIDNFTLSNDCIFAWNKLSYVPREWFNKQMYINLIFVIQSHQANIIYVDDDNQKQTVALEENHAYLCNCSEEHTFTNNSILSRLTLSLKYNNIDYDTLLNGIENKNLLKIHTMGFTQKAWSV